MKPSIRIILGSLLLWIMAHVAAAHDITPTLAEIEHHGSTIELELSVNAEAFAAQLDLDGLARIDTDDSRYQTLHALPPSKLAPVVRAQAAKWRSKLVTQGEMPVSLRLSSVEIGPVGAGDQPRITTIRFKADVTGPVKLHWPKGAGDLLLRQTGSSAPYSALLQSGETTAEIAHSGSRRAGWLVFATYVSVGLEAFASLGPEHALFALALFFLSTSPRMLAGHLVVYTLAFGAVLVLSVAVPVQTVIPSRLLFGTVIAAAAWVVFHKITSAWTHVFIAICAGVHALAFGNILTAMGMPNGQAVLAVIGVMTGMQIGLLLVVTAAFGTLGYWMWDKPWYRARVAIPAAVVIGALSVGLALV